MPDPCKTILGNINGIRNETEILLKHAEDFLKSKFEGAFDIYENLNKRMRDILNEGIGFVQNRRECSEIEKAEKAIQCLTQVSIFSSTFFIKFRIYQLFNFKL